MSINRPLKAPTDSLEDWELEKLPYPVVGSPKIDGFRCVVDTIPLTSSMKPQPNPFIQKELSKPEYNGLDGELVLGKPNDPDAFNISTGPLRRGYGKPDFTFYVFDSFLSSSSPYLNRWILELSDFPTNYPRIIALPQEILKTPEEIIAFTDACLEQNYEGAMIRSLLGKYKQGRATFNEMNIFKRKPLTDAEGIIIGFKEQMTNNNAKETNEIGLTRRASNKENKTPAGTLGSLILENPKWKTPFSCGCGKMNHQERKALWELRKNFLGKKVTFKYQAYGSIDKPRQPRYYRFYKEV